MATVWVTQETKHDIRAAETFGDIDFVTFKDFLSIPNSSTNDRLSGDLLVAANKVGREDWIVPVGSPYVSMVFCAMVYRRLGVLRVLRWSNRDDCYYPLELGVTR